MDKREAMLRELNLYPQWVRRNQPAPKVGNPLSAEADVELTPPVEVEALVQVLAADDNQVAGYPNPSQPPLVRGGARKLVVFPPDRTTSHSTRLSKDDSQVAGYDKGGSRGVEGEALDWPELKQKVHDCTACRLRAGCTQTVFGVGDEQADWLFVGEGPGADEDALGEPFVGQAGKLLDSMLAAIKLKRGKNVFIANIVKCRPPDNRNPAADEIAQCLPYLERQIELIQPRLIVALGKVASNALLGKDATLASLRGKPHDYHGIPLIVTYHPAYLLRSPSEKAKAWQDLCFAAKTRHGQA
jgi:DNA polymerase